MAMLVNSVLLLETIMAGRLRLPITASSSRGSRHFRHLFRGGLVLQLKVCHHKIILGVDLKGGLNGYDRMDASRSRDRVL